jgi:integral membrane sensor domain MASE1
MKSGRVGEYLTRAVLLGSLYYAGGRLGLLSRLVTGLVSPFWAPTGVAVALLLIFGLRYWPAVAAAALALEVPLPYGSAAAAIVTTIGDTAAPVLAVCLLRRVGFRTELARFRDAFWLLVAAASCMLVSSAGGCLALYGVAHASMGAPLWQTWSVWWTGDALGVLVVAPVIFVLSRWDRLADVSAAQRGEAMAVLGLVIAAALIATAGSAPWLFVILPPLVWASVRFRQTGAAFGALIGCASAVVAAAHEWGAFADSDNFASVFRLQAFAISVVLTSMLLATITAQRDQARTSLERANAELALLVEIRNAQIARDLDQIGELNDRRQIATQLHDVVIQRLFAIGLQLESAVRTDDSAKAHERIHYSLDELDETIDRLRAAIAELAGSPTN